MERITSRTNETVKAVVRLRERAERARRRLFFCEGVHLAEEFLRHGRPVERVFATDAALESHGALLAGFGDRVTLVTPEVYGKLSEEKAPQGILLVAPWPENVSGRKPSAKRRSILLDGLAKIDGIRCNRPNGAFYVFADISSFGLSSVEFCNRLLDEQKVVCIPGSAFGECGEGFIRIAYTCSDDNLYEALNRISCFCKKLMK